MAEDDARHRLDLDVADRGALDLGEVADLRLRELDVLQRLARKLVEAVLLLPVAQPIIVAVPPVEAHRQLPHRRIPPRPNVRQNTLHNPPNRTVRVQPHINPRTSLQPLDRKSKSMNSSH